ncbi:hypothetical protein IEQ34_004536 [Dendrobium chrysotoxum]|uniref:Uncharacterized protein n=1 Tax=Dendrobium chrysotoxum TaxID=161865 RepID=A0AAV7HIM2_DENCH|nr:hypothetical protein IEQ34_004536 [Dendrobium chrysotoxum]
MRKITLLQRIYEDEMVEEFDLNTWVCVSIKIKSHCWRNRSPLAAKVIGGVLKDNLDERHWRTLLKSSLLDQNFYQFNLETKPYSSAKTSTKLSCILLHAPTRSGI